MSSQVRPSFFCSRPNGSLTPLIALDDLPAGVTVRGVPRTLTPGETQGMISCGASEPRSEPWALEGATPAGPGCIGDPTELQAVLLKIMADNNVAPHLRQSIKDILYRGLGAEAPVANGVAARHSPVYYGNTGDVARNAGHGHGGHANGKHGFNAKKEFCSYWIRHGECDYQQQGCLYKHQMPTDLVMLEKLGLRDIPRWYREKHNVPSLLQANYGNHNRGQLHQAVIEQPPIRAIQYQLAADNASATGLSGHSGPSGHANGHANANAANKNRNGNHHGHGHGNGNNNNNNGNHNGQAHPRGGRYKSPRGAGFAAGKSRGSSNWNNAAVRDNVTPPPAENGNAASDNSSPNTSEQSGSSFRNGAKINLMASPIISPLAEAENPQHILDKDGKVRKSLCARLRELTTEDAFGGPIQGEPLPDTFRTKSRRLFDFGNDGANSTGTGFDPYASVAKLETGNKANASTSASPLSKLVATSEPINPNEPLINWGPIGEPIQRPASVEGYMMAPMNGQPQNGLNAQPHPDIRRH